MPTASRGSCPKTPLRRSRAFLGILICVAIAAYGLSSTLAVALSSPMPISCDEAMSHQQMASDGSAGVPAAAVAGLAGHRQGICAQPGCVIATPVARRTGILGAGLSVRIDFAADEHSRVGGAVSPDHRPPREL